MALPMILLLLSVITGGIAEMMLASLLQYRITHEQYQRAMNVERIQQLQSENLQGIVNDFFCYEAVHSTAWFTKQSEFWWRQHDRCKKNINHQDIYYIIFTRLKNSCDTLNGRFVDYNEIIIHAGKPAVVNLAVTVATPTDGIVHCQFPGSVLSQAIQSERYV